MLYIATLQPGGDPENVHRIMRHQASRAGQSFETVELYTPQELEHFCDSSEDLDGQVVLLDCLGVMLSQAKFIKNDDEEWVEVENEKVERDTMVALQKLAMKTADLIIVAPDIFKAPVADEVTDRYRQVLGKALQLIVRELDASVVEVVAGIPVIWRDRSGNLSKEFDQSRAIE